MSLRPIVDGLQIQYANRVRIVRVDLLTPTGRELANRYGFDMTPFFVGLNAGGNVAWKQTGTAPTTELIDKLGSTQ